MKQQVRVYYSGRVQGVGFRFTAESVANELGVTGWVKNLDDGRVEIVAEAENDTLLVLLDKIGKCFAQYITDTEAEWLKAEGKFKGFGVGF